MFAGSESDVLEEKIKSQGSSLINSHLCKYLE